jgi:putative colanic acid biosynthesis acetyltransferase WcaF
MKKMSQHLSSSERFPYSWKEYVLKFVWRIVWLSIWRICWHRVYILRSCILKCFGAKVSIKSMYYGSTWIEFPWKFSCGRFSTIGPRVHIYNLGYVSIGENTVVSQDVYLCAGTHLYNYPAMPLLKETIEIGASVWICAGAFIGPGVTVGEGAIVGARGVAMSDVPPWTIVAGNPARKIKKREMAFSD